MSGNLSSGWSADYLPKKLYLEKKFADSSALSEALRNKSYDRFLRLLALFVSDGTPTTFTWSPDFAFGVVSNRGLCQLGGGCCELSEDKTDQWEMLTCDEQLLWWYVCLLRGYSWFQQIFFVSQILHNNSKQLFNLYCVHFGKWLNEVQSDQTACYACCQRTLLSMVQCTKENEELLTAGIKIKMMVIQLQKVSNLKKNILLYTSICKLIFSRTFQSHSLIDM